MFKKIYERLDKMSGDLKDISCRTIALVNRQNEKTYDPYKPRYEHCMRIVEEQQATINQLLGALRDKYEHGLFIFSKDGKIPTVIRNGKELTNDMTTSFSIDWSTGEFPNIQFEQVGGTCRDRDN